MKQAFRSFRRDACFYFCAEKLHSICVAVRFSLKPRLGVGLLEEKVAEGGGGFGLK